MTLIVLLNYPQVWQCTKQFKKGQFVLRCLALAVYYIYLLLWAFPTKIFLNQLTGPLLLLLFYIIYDVKLFQNSITSPDGGYPLATYF